MNIRKYISLFLVAALSLSVIVQSDAAARKEKKKKGKDKTEQTDTVKKETPYEKLFKDKKFVTATGFVTVHLMEDGEIIMELPKSLLGRDMTMSSVIESTSDGGDGAAGFVSPGQLPVRFTATDSLVLIHKISSRRFLTDADNMKAAVDANNISPVVAKLPIAAHSADSSALVFKITPFFKKHHKELEPNDDFCANSFEGLISKKLSLDVSTAMFTGVDAYAGTDVGSRSISVSSLFTYTYSESLMNVKFEGDLNRLTVRMKTYLMLLPQQMMKPRFADPRIGVKPVSHTLFSSKDQGAEEVNYAVRWNLPQKESITFYVDTLFPKAMSDAIVKGILKWNDAFAGIGKPGFVKAVPYPSDASFSSEDPFRLCVKYEVASNYLVRNSILTDPRSGEILGGCIYVPYDFMKNEHCQLITDLGSVDASLLTGNHNLPAVYEALQSKITNVAGACLGLQPNYAASYAMPVDSLRSPSFTSEYGLSASVMDDLPYNFFAKKGDKEKGVKLIHTELGNYDRYAIKWLYGTIDGVSSPEEEKPYLDSMIIESKKDPYCFFVRYQPYQKYDPRTCLGDLGNNAIESTKARIENIAEVIAGMDEWVAEADPDYTLRPYLNAATFITSIYQFTYLARLIGGIYFDEAYVGDDVKAFKAVPGALQREAMLYLLQAFKDFSWMDNYEAYKDIFFIRSPAGFMPTMVLSIVFEQIAAADLSASVAGDDAYGMMDAYKDVYDVLLKDARTGKTPTYNYMQLQYTLVGFTMALSEMIPPRSSEQGRGITADRRFHLDENYNFVSGVPEEFSLSSDPIMSFPFYAGENHGHEMYAMLLDIKKVYERAIKIAEDESTANHYRYFVLAIDDILKIE